MSLFRDHPLDPVPHTRRDRIIAFAARRRLPAIYQFRQFTVAGGILNYGLNFTDVYRQVGLYVAKFSAEQSLPIYLSNKSRSSSWSSI